MKLALGFKGERFIYLPLSILEKMPQSPLTGDLYIYSLGYFAKAAHHYIDRPLGCDQHLLIYCTEGCGNVKIDHNEFTLHPNQFIILPPNIRHQYKADDKDPWSIYWIHFKGEKADLITHGLNIPHSISPSEESRIENRLTLFEEMYMTLKEGFESENINYANFCLSYFIASLIYIKQYRISNRKSEYTGCIINRAIYYMNENINKALTIEDISSFINYSPSYFYRKFIKEIGLAPMSYFTNMKINKACKLLSLSDLQINQIAATIGYNDPLYFSRVFAKRMGISPQKYRAKERDEK